MHPVMIHGKWRTWHTILVYVFISILYLFRATSCSSSGETVISIQPLAYVTLCRLPFRVQVGKFLSDLHTKRSPTQSDICQRLCWYNSLSWWWARGCSKHVENWNKYVGKNCASSWSFTMNQKPVNILPHLLTTSTEHISSWETNSSSDIEEIVSAASYRFSGCVRRLSGSLYTPN